MIIPTPMPLGQQSKPFDEPDWLYEIKHDGFRALALIDRGHCWFVSRRKHKFHGFRDLAAALVREVNAEVAVLDGELAVPDHTGRTVFAAMMKHRQQARFYAFDLLYLNGEDLRQLPLLTRKAKLRRLLPARSAHVLYVDHTKGSGQRLYELACELDLEGIVAKRADNPYEEDARNPHWIKIKNQAYSQKEGRGKLFRRAVG
jgi:bifunctional non-homologous end joining protein LigD